MCDHRALTMSPATTISITLSAHQVEQVVRAASRERAPGLQHTVDRFIWLRSEKAGWWQPSVRVGDQVAAGGRLGAVLDPYGDELETIEAPEAGVPLFITSSPAVTDDGLLLGLGAGISPLE